MVVCESLYHIISNLDNNMDKHMLVMLEMYVFDFFKKADDVDYVKDSTLLGSNSITAFANYIKTRKKLPRWNKQCAARLTYLENSTSADLHVFLKRIEHMLIRKYNKAGVQWYRDK